MEKIISMRGCSTEVTKIFSNWKSYEDLHLFSKFGEKSKTFQPEVAKMKAKIIELLEQIINGISNKPEVVDIQSTEQDLRRLAEEWD